ncbi:LytTR family DNA-binding domain-containing protein [Enterococcus termitis]|uniref:HTH LytTR-type domain-containing protein n=1 Tax=Enterococcus termitis TaxID=332950 RepID=A0A1E5H154_9ENTE|nr:LytTR family DNA-binding domain-containing protein [Enterococcus termitis]OEG18727.1 hypothetical protein BCR25_16130 [Enterococcus termitis]OJG97549.1 hypothetical protein RV18_GL000617 [Enterococcus termitis]
MNNVPIYLDVSTEFEDLEIVIRTNDRKTGEQLRQYLGEVRRRKIKIQIKGSVVIIYEDKILFVESYLKKINIVTAKETYVIDGPMYVFMDILNDMHFRQVSKSMYINVQYLKKIEKSFSGNYVGYLKESSLQISISRRYVKSLFEFLRSVYR